MIELCVEPFVLSYIPCCRHLRTPWQASHHQGRSSLFILSNCCTQTVAMRAALFRGTHVMDTLYFSKIFFLLLFAAQNFLAV